MEDLADIGDFHAAQILESRWPAPVNMSASASENVLRNTGVLGRKVGFGTWLRRT